MFGGPRGILGPPPMGMNMMGRPTALLHDMNAHRGVAPLQAMQRMPDGLNPPIVTGPNGAAIMPSAVGLMPPQSGELCICSSK